MQLSESIAYANTRVFLLTSTAMIILQYNANVIEVEGLSRSMDKVFLLAALVTGPKYHLGYRSEYKQKDTHDESEKEREREKI